MALKDMFREGDALLVVDVQNDFCPGGALAIAGGDAVVPVLNAWIEAALNRRIPIFVSRDWHPEGHVSFKESGGPWPRHCVQDTDGARFHPDFRVPPEAVKITKGTRLDHDQLSAFDETGLAEALRRLKIKRVIIGGLAQDVCVLLSAQDARRAGLAVAVIKDGTRPISAESGEKALAKMRAAGVALGADRASHRGCRALAAFGRRQRHVARHHPAA